MEAADCRIFYSASENEGMKLAAAVYYAYRILPNILVPRSIYSSMQYAVQRTALQSRIHYKI